MIQSRELSQQENFPGSLLEYLEQQLQHPVLPFHWENFYKGEYFFYSRRYDQALRCYLNAASLPRYTFFCFRSAAFLLEQLGRNKKAKEFASKALQIFSDDYVTTLLLERVQATSEYSSRENEVAMPVIPIGEEEWKELNAIFSSVKEQPLFSSETSR